MWTHTASRIRPLNLRRLITALPPRLLIRALKPWTRCRRRFLGCQVRLGIAFSSALSIR